MNIFERIFFHAPISADICLISERMILFTVENRIKLCLILLALLFSSGQVTWFFYRLYMNPDIAYACHYAPILFTCLFATIAIIQIFMKHAEFKRSITFIRTHFWAKELAIEEAKAEMSQEIGHIKRLIITIIPLTSVTALAFMPLNEIDYVEDFFPFMDFLGQCDIPENVKYYLAISIYPLMFPMTYCVAIYGVLISFFLSNSMTQAIMIKWCLINITKDLEVTGDNSELLEDIKKQRIIKSRLIKCIKHHITLCSFAKLVQKYLYYTLIWHIMTVVILTASLFYMIFFQDATPRMQLAWYIQSLVVATGIYFYCFMGESFAGQMDQISDAAAKSNWYYFNDCNRQIFSIFLMNLRRKYHIECAGIFHFNLELNIWIFNKAFALVSVFSAVNE